MVVDTSVVSRIAPTGTVWQRQYEVWGFDLTEDVLVADEAVIVIPSRPPWRMWERTEAYGKHLARQAEQEWRVEALCPQDGSVLWNRSRLDVGTPIGLVNPKLVLAALLKNPEQNFAGKPGLWEFTAYEPATGKVLRRWKLPFRISDLSWPLDSASWVPKAKRGSELASFSWSQDYEGQLREALESESAVITDIRVGKKWRIAVRALTPRGVRWVSIDPEESRRADRNDSSVRQPS